MHLFKILKRSATMKSVFFNTLAKQFKLALQTKLWLHHPLSRAIGALARCRWFWVKASFIRIFLTLYAVNMEEAEQANPYHYANFNAFFTRSLKPNCRPINPSPDTYVSPVDGIVSEIGHVAEGQLIHAKGANLSIVGLLGGDINQASLFNGGSFATFYLAPHNYHKVHLPYPGQLKQMVYIPGLLFSVNPLTVAHIPNVLTRNERLVMHFETDQGPLCVVMVGAMIVGSLATPWTGVIQRSASPKIEQWSYETSPMSFEKGDEIGRFELGSTVIVLRPHTGKPWRDTLIAGNQVIMGHAIT